MLTSTAKMLRTICTRLCHVTVTVTVTVTVIVTVTVTELVHISIPVGISASDRPGLLKSNPACKPNRWVSLGRLCEQCLAAPS